MRCSPRTAIHRERHAGRGFAACDGFHAVCHVVATAAELAAKLRDQCRRLIFVGPLEGAPGHAGYDPRDRAHGKKNRQREHQQKFAAKAQGFPVSSQTSCKRQLPSGSSCQPITFAPNATAVRKCSSGITRCDCSSVLSAAYAWMRLQSAAADHHRISVAAIPGFEQARRARPRHRARASACGPVGCRRSRWL